MSFDSRKKDHIKLALQSKNQVAYSSLDSVELQHDPLVDFDFEDISIEKVLFKKKMKAPFYVNAMTAGHRDSLKINESFAYVCEKKSWLLGVGSQRGQILNPKKSKEWTQIRKKYPKVELMGNIGLTQLIGMKFSEMDSLIDSLGKPLCFAVHTNPLQECLQEEGTPQFKGSLKALKEFTSHFKIPFVLKEVGCGFSLRSLKKLSSVKNLKALDVSGYGGTHWGRIELDRIKKDSYKKEAGKSFSHWGISTLDSLLNAKQAKASYEIWASGGIRSGLHAAKCFALGAQMVGFAQPLLKALKQKGKKGVEFQMNVFEHELKIAMFCCGIKNLKEFKKYKVWKQKI